MVRDDDDGTTTSDAGARDGAISRRQMLTTAGLAAGAGLVTGDAALAQGSSGRGLVGVGAQGATAVEFRARFAQTGSSGERFVAYGYITAAVGATFDDLFAGAQPGEATALLTAYAEGELVRRTFDQSVHALDIEGTLTIYQRRGPGASFATPASFQVGTPVAGFSMKLQDIVTVFAPGRGLPTLNGDMEQTFAEAIAPGRRFGHVGARTRLFASGMGTLVDPVTFNSLLEMAGNWTIQ